MSRVSQNTYAPSSLQWEERLAGTKHGISKDDQEQRSSVLWENQPQHLDYYARFLKELAFGGCGGTCL